MRWHLAGWRDRRRTHSRPRVARAAEAARLAQESVGWSLGSATAGVGVMLTPAFTTSPAMMTVSGVEPELALVARRLARATGRSAEDVWAEAMRAWLDLEMAPQARSSRPAATEMRRTQVWREIDETLGALRAS